MHPVPLSLCLAAVDLAGFKELNAGNGSCAGREGGKERALCLHLSRLQKKRKKGRRNRDRKVPIALGGEEKRVKVCPALLTPNLCQLCCGERVPSGGSRGTSQRARNCWGCCRRCYEGTSSRGLTC